LGDLAAGVDDGDFGQALDKIHLGKLLGLFGIALLVDAVPVDPKMAQPERDGKGYGILDCWGEFRDVESWGKERG